MSVEDVASDGNVDIDEIISKSDTVGDTLVIIVVRMNLVCL